MNRRNLMVVVGAAVLGLAADDASRAASPRAEAPVEHFTDAELGRRASAPGAALVDFELDAHVSSARCYRNSIGGSRTSWIECEPTLTLGPRLRDLPGGRLPDERVLRGSLSLRGLPDSQALRLLTPDDPMRVRLTVERP